VVSNPTFYEVHAMSILADAHDAEAIIGSGCIAQCNIYGQQRESFGMMVGGR